MTANVDLLATVCGRQSRGPYGAANTEQLGSSWQVFDRLVAVMCRQKEDNQSDMQVIFIEKANEKDLSENKALYKRQLQLRSMQVNRCR